MIKIYIQFCINNLANGSYKTLEVLKRDSNFDIVEYPCLKHCSLCEKSPYALVDGHLISADTPDQLVDRIYQFVDEQIIY